MPEKDQPPTSSLHPQSRLKGMPLWGLGFGIFCLCLGVGLAQVDASRQNASGQALKQEEVRMQTSSAYIGGEHLKYRVHYGFINAGEASLRVYDRLVRQGAEDKPCYRVEVYGRSSGTFDRFVKIRNTWGSIIDTSTARSLRAYRDIQENRYRLKEDITFDYDRNFIKVRIQDRKDTLFRLGNTIRDIVSSYYYLRQVDYNRLRPGDVVLVDAFFENKFYKMKVRYVGKGEVKTKYGKVRSLILSPIMPENGLFDGENSIKMFMSDDVNHMPVKVSAELFVGAVELDLVDYGGTRTILTTQ